MEITCAQCQRKFDKEQKEITRQTKRGRTDFFCSRTCSATFNILKNPRLGNTEFLKSDNKKDQYSPYRWFILRAEYRDRKKHNGCDIDVEFLKELWEKQNGICSLTGWNLILPENTTGWKEINPANASLDRVDCSRGYLRDNVRFVAYIANIARGIFSDEQLINFCKAVAGS